MKTKFRCWGLLPAVLAGICVIPLSASAAKQTPEQSALWAASANTPLTFTIPASQGRRTMEKAQVLIAEWCTIDSNDAAMAIRVATDNVIAADFSAAPQATSLGFLVTCSPTNAGDEISVNTLYPFNEIKDSVKRAHLLSFLLQQYAGTLFTTSGDLDAYMKDLNSQLDSGQYATAVATIDALRAAVVAKQAAQGAAPVTAGQ